MKANQVMTANIESCGATTDLAAAAMIMWRNDCGVVPVVIEPHRKVIGLLTDRDICMAAGTKHRAACDISVGEVMSSEVITCREADDVRDVLRRMREHRVRRLPVLNEKGELQGIVAINDLVLAAEEDRIRQSEAGLAEDVLATLRDICEHRAETGQVTRSQRSLSKSPKKSERRTETAVR